MEITEQVSDTLVRINNGIYTTLRCTVCAKNLPLFEYDCPICQRVKQARREVAEAIFAELEHKYMEGGEHPRMDGVIIRTPRMIRMSEDELQELKAKYPGE